MDFHGMNRRQLQALCKKHGIPANKSNLEMANLLTSLLQVTEKLPSQESSVVVDSEEKSVEKRVKRVRFSPDIEIRMYDPSAYKVSRRQTRSGRSFDVDGDSVVRTRQSREEKQDRSVVQVKKRGRRDRKMDIVESEPNCGTCTHQLRNRKILSKESGGKDEEDKARQRKSRKRKNEKATKENTPEEEVAEPGNVSSRPKRDVRKKASKKAEKIEITGTVTCMQAKARSTVSVIEDKETQEISDQSMRRKSVSSLKELQSEVLIGDNAEVQKGVTRQSKRNIANLVDSQPSMTVELKKVVSGKMTRSRAKVTTSASLNDGKDVVQVEDMERTQRRNPSRGRSTIPKKVNVKNDGQDVKENRKKSDNLDVEVASVEALDQPSLRVEHLRRSRHKVTASDPSVRIDKGVIGEAVRKSRFMTKQVSDKDQHATVEPLQINKRVSGLDSKVKNSATKEIAGKRVKAGKLKQKVAEVMDKEVSVALDEFVVGPPVPDEVAEMKQSLVTEDSKSNQVLTDDEALAGYTGITAAAGRSCSKMNSSEELVKSSNKTRSSKVRSSKKKRNDSATDSSNINLDLEGNMASPQSKSLTASEETRDMKQTLCDEEGLTKDTGMTKPEALENKNCLSLNSESELVRSSDKTSNLKSRSSRRRNDSEHDSNMQFNIVCHSTSVLEGNMASTQFECLADSADERPLAFPLENEVISNETNNTIVDDRENLVSVDKDDAARSNANQNSVEAELTGETMNRSPSDKGLIENELSLSRVIIHEILSAKEALTGYTEMTTPAAKSCLNVNSCTEPPKSSKVISSKKRRNDAARDSAVHLNVADSSKINLDLEGITASPQSKSLTSSEETRDTKQPLCDEEALTKDIGIGMTKPEAVGNKHCLSLNSERELMKSSDKTSSFKSRSCRTRRDDSVHDSDMQLNVVCHSNTTSVLEGNMASTRFECLADSADERPLAFPRENEVISNETNNTVVDDVENLVSVDMDDAARSTANQNSVEAELTGETMNNSQSDKGLIENELSSSRVIIHEILFANEALTGYTEMTTPAEKSCWNLNSCMEPLKSSKVRSSKKRRNGTALDSAVNLNVADSSKINLDLEGIMASPQSKSLTSSEETRDAKQPLNDEEALTKDIGTGVNKPEAVGNKHCLSLNSKRELIKSSDKTSSFKSGSSRTRSNDSVLDSDKQLNIVCHSNTTSVLEGNMASRQFESLADSADERALATPRGNEEIVNETNTTVDDTENLVSADTNDVARSIGKQNSAGAELPGLQSNSKLNIASSENYSDVEGDTMNRFQSDKGLMEYELSPCRVMIHEKDEPVDASTKVDGSFTLDLEQSLQNAACNAHEGTERRSLLDSDSIVQDSMKETLVTPDRHTYSPLQNQGAVPMLQEDGGDEQDDVLTQTELEISFQSSIKRLHVEKKCNTEMAENSNDYGASICKQSEKAIQLGCAIDVEFGDFNDSQMVSTEEVTMSSPKLMKEVLLELPDLVFPEKTVVCSSEREFPGENGREDSSESSERIFTRSISPESKFSVGSVAGSASTSDSLETTDTLSDKEINSVRINFQHSSNCDTQISDTLVEDESAQVLTDALATMNTLNNEEIMSVMIGFQNNSNGDEQITDTSVENGSAQVHSGNISSGSGDCSSHGEEYSDTNYTIPRGSSNTSFRHCEKRSGATNNTSEAQKSSDILFSSTDVNSELNVFSCHGNDAILSEESKGLNEVDGTPSPTATDVQYISNVQDMANSQDVQGNLSDDQGAKMKEAGCYFEETDFMLPTPPGSIGFMVESMQTKVRSALPTFSSTAVTSILFKEVEEDMEIKQIPSPKTSAAEEFSALVPPLIGSPHDDIQTEDPLGSAFFLDWEQGNNKEDVTENTANSDSKTDSLDKCVTLSAQVHVKEDKTICKPDGLMNTSPLEETDGVSKSPTLDQASNQMALSPWYGNPDVTSYSSTGRQQNLHAFSDVSQQFHENNDKVEAGEHSLIHNHSGDAVRLSEIKNNAADGSLLDETLSVVHFKNLVGLENFDFHSPYKHGNFSAVHNTPGLAFGLDLGKGEPRENVEVVEKGHNEVTHQSEQVILDKLEIGKGGESEQEDEMTLPFSNIQLPMEPKCQIENAAFGLELEKVETQENAGEVAETEHKENAHQSEQVISDKPEFVNDMTLEFNDIQLSMKTECQNDKSIRSGHACVSSQKLTMIEGSVPDAFLDDATTSEWTMKLDAINTDEDKSLNLVSKLDMSMLDQSPAITSSIIDQGIIAQEDCCNPDQMTTSNVKEQDTNGSSYRPSLPFAQFLAESNSHHCKNSAVDWKKNRSVLILGTPKKTLQSKESMSRTKMEGVGNMTAPKLLSKRLPLEDLTNNKSN